MKTDLTRPRARAVWLGVALLMSAAFAPRMAQAQAQGTTLKATASVPSVCQLRQRPDVSMTALGDTATQVTTWVEASANGRYQIVARLEAVGAMRSEVSVDTEGETNGTAPGSPVALVFVQNDSGAFLPLTRHDPKVIVLDGQPGAMWRKVVYRVLGVTPSPDAAAADRPRVGLACVLGDSKVASGVVLGM